jgi:hypothetical protein
MYDSGQMQYDGDQGQDFQENMNSNFNMGGMGGQGMKFNNGGGMGGNQGMGNIDPN